MISKTSESIPLKLFHRTFRKLLSFLSKGCQKLPKTPLKSPIVPPSTNKISSKLGQLDTSCKNVTKKRDSKGQTKGDDSMNIADLSVGKVLKEVKNAANEHPARKKEKSRFLDTDMLAQRMEELEKIDVNDEDQALDLQEVLHCYSHLTVPVYVEIVKKVLMDMHKEVHILQNSEGVNNSMRKHCSARVYSSMTSDPGHLKL